VSRDQLRVRVTEVIAETADAVTLVLDADFAYRPGQFLTVRGPDAWRCYSLSSTPQTDPKPRITIKRVRDGRISNWICDTIVPGATLDVLPPAGTFTPASLAADLLLLAGGSGITPVISIVKAALASGRGHVALVYANRDPDSVIFAAELHDLAARYPDRLHVRHWYDAVDGNPSVATLTPLLRPYADRDAFLCGPTPFMAVASGALTALGVPVDRVHVERFEVAPGPTPLPGPTSTAEVELDGQTYRLPWPAGTRLLDVLIGAGLNPPFSCRQGNCGACACRVLAGEVELLHNEILQDEDFADGYTLACQAVPVSDHVRVTYS
jgi:3-ketosteroid 9alpha-monooxygenase subunit B